MTSIKLKAKPLVESSSESEDEEEIQRRVQEMSKKLSCQGEPTVKKFKGGLVISSETEDKASSIAANLSAAEKRSMKEVAELERELDLTNTFSKETNRRDEDAEMNKYIEEQIRLRREKARKELQSAKVAPDDNDDQYVLEPFMLPAAATDKIEDILLHSLAKNFVSPADEKSEAMLSSQMLNGIPEVDLGVSERIRTIEATEEAKLKMTLPGSSRHSHRGSRSVPVNHSSNFRQNRFQKEVKTSTHDKQPDAPKIVTESVVVVGEEPREVEYKLPSTGQRPPPRGKPSDDYYLSKFKKNIRR